MAKKRTPPPEPPELQTKRGCAVAVAGVTCVFGVVVAITEWWWLLVFCVPGFLTFVYWLHGKLLLLTAHTKYRKRGIAGVLVTSDSPNWNAYIQENWISQFGEHFVILNWSQRKTWESSLAVNLFSRFCSYEENFCPAVILFRGLRYPLVFRFFLAFRDYKHGNEAALQTLERRLYDEVGLRDNSNQTS